MMMVLCAGCERPILDKFLLNVLDCTWHSHCVQCSDCKCGLTEKCFSRDGKLYCREDFFRRFGTKCSGCTNGISPSDLVRKAKDKVFHLKCFTCMVCQKQLSTGEELYVLDDNKFVCKYDFINSKLSGPESDDDMDYDNTPEHCENSEKDYSLQSEENCDVKNFIPEVENNMKTFPHSPIQDSVSIKREPTEPESMNSNSENILNQNPGSVGSDGNSAKSCVTDLDQTDNSTSNLNNDLSDIENAEDEITISGKKEGTAGAKRRGPRTTIKAKQLEVLKSAFSATPKPTRHIREQLAKETGLNMRVIQVWFQNRRSKERRMKQLSALGARRHFFRNPRRMRGPGMSPDDSPDMMCPPGFGYFPDDNAEFCGGYQGYGDFFPGQDGPGMGYMTSPPGHPGSHPMHMEQPMMGSMPAGMGDIPTDDQFIPNDLHNHSSMTPPMSLDAPTFCGSSTFSQARSINSSEMTKVW